MLPFAQRVEELEGELKEKDSELLKRDRIITELRLRLPATSDRDAVFDKVASQSIKSPRDEDYEGSQAVRVATSTVSSLQVCTHRYSYNTHTHTSLTEILMTTEITHNIIIILKHILVIYRTAKIKSTEAILCVYYVCIFCILYCIVLL